MRGNRDAKHIMHDFFVDANCIGASQSDRTTYSIKPGGANKVRWGRLPVRIGEIRINRKVLASDGDWEWNGDWD